MIKLPKSFIAAGYKFECEIPAPKLETERTPEGSFVLRALYEENGIEEFAKQAAREMNEKVEAAIMDELLRMNGYVPERTCHKEIMTTENYAGTEVEFFGCSECGEYLSDTDCYGLDDGPNYCENCGCKVDSSFVTDENTGEVIYRDGQKVVE